MVSIFHMKYTTTDEPSSFSCTAHIPLYLYPFLNTTSKSRPFEYLRLTSLGVIGALVKVNHSVPLLLFWGSEKLSKWYCREFVFLLQVSVWNKKGHWHPYFTLLSRLMIQRSLASFFPLKLFLCASVPWRWGVSCQKQYAFSTFTNLFLMFLDNLKNLFRWAFFCKVPFCISNRW